MIITINQSKIINYTAKQMYDLVDNIKSYPEFLPWCNKTYEIERNRQSVIATIEIMKSGIKKSFTTKNILTPNKSVVMELVTGPFKHFESYWQFNNLSQSCEIKFYMSFEFSNRFIATMLNSIFEQIVNKMIDAFSNRAKQIYSNHLIDYAK